MKSYNNVKITINPPREPPQALFAYLRAIDDARALFTELTPEHWERLQKCAERGPRGLLQLVESVHYDYQRTGDVESLVRYWEERTGIR